MTGTAGGIRTERDVVRSNASTRMEAAVPEFRRCFHFVGGGWNKPDRVTLVGGLALLLLLLLFFPLPAPARPWFRVQTATRSSLFHMRTTPKKKKLLLQSRVRVNTYTCDMI